jgi:hypothetical protein
MQALITVSSQGVLAAVQNHLVLVFGIRHILRIELDRVGPHHLVEWCLRCPPDVLVQLGRCEPPEI